MRSFSDRAIRKGLAKIRSILRRAERRYAAAGHKGGGGHIGWLDYETVIYRALEFQYWESKANVTPFGAYYEFGLSAGESFSRCYKTVSSLTRHLGYSNPAELGFKMVGFDSFEGLPVPKEWDQRVGWEKGTYACGRDTFTKNMDAQRVPRDIYRLVEGFYENSLTDALRVELEAIKPSLIMMDSDLYSSTRTVLEWLRPLLRDGTIFMFDDIWAYQGHPNFGELRAIREFNEKKEGLLVPHYYGGATQQVYLYTTGYQGAAYQDYLKSVSHEKKTS